MQNQNGCRVRVVLRSRISDLSAQLRHATTAHFCSALHQSGIIWKRLSFSHTKWVIVLKIQLQYRNNINAQAGVEMFFVYLGE